MVQNVGFYCRGVDMDQEELEKPYEDSWAPITNTIIENINFFFLLTNDLHLKKKNYKKTKNM